MEEAVNHPNIDRQYAVDLWIADVENLEGSPVDSIESDDHKQKPPGVLAGEEVGVAASRMIKQESESSSTLAPYFTIETLDDLQHGPHYQAEENRITGVSRENEETHGDEEIVASLKGRHVGVE